MGLVGSTGSNAKSLGTSRSLELSLEKQIRLDKVVSGDQRVYLVNGRFPSLTRIVRLFGRINVSVYLPSGTSGT